MSRYILLPCMAIGLVSLMAISTLITTDVTESSNMSLSNAPEDQLQQDLTTFLISDPHEDLEVKKIENALISQHHNIIEASDSLSVLSSESIALIDSSWVEKQTKSSLNSEMTFALDNEIVIISLDGASLFMDKDIDMGSIVLSESSNVCAVYYDKNSGIKYCYSVECEDYDEAISKAHRWALNLLDDIISKTNSNPLFPPGTVMSEKNHQCGNYGYMNISTAYIPLPSSSNDKDYWTVHYYVETVPNSGKFNSGLTIENKVDTYDYVPSGLMRHGPQTTTGSTTVTVGVNISEAPSVYSEWAREIPDINVLNYSALNTNTFKVVYDVSLSSSISTTTLFAEPGMTFWCGKGSSDLCYTGVDQYTATFYGNKIGVHKVNVQSFETNLCPILYDDR